MNEKFINPKRQKYSKYEKRGYAEKKKIFRAKKSPQTLDVRGDPVKLGVKRKRQSFSFRSRNLKIGKYYLVHPETKSVFRFLVTSTKDMGEFTGITPEFPAVHVSNRDKRSGNFRNYDRVSWYDKWRSNKKGELAPCPQALRITEQGIYYSDVAEKHLELPCHQGVCERCPVRLGSFRKHRSNCKWINGTITKKRFVNSSNHTAERWMETQLKQKGLEQYFLAKIDDMQKTIVRFVLDPKGDTYNYQVIYMSDLAGINRP